MSFAGKNILIVGGSSGIGLALVQQLSDAGAAVYNASRHASDKWPAGVVHVELDVLGDTAALAEKLPEHLHGLVYCVGSINLKPFNRLTQDDFLNDYRLNVIGAVAVIQQALKALKSTQAASIVLFSTVAAKAGMGLALSLAAELVPQHIRVNVIAPSLTDTPLAHALLNTPEKRDASAKRHPLGKFGSANDIAAAARFLLSDESTWMTGQVIGIDGGLSNLRTI
jgi:3-oxoacyl-[acyl-carrier protein] reductase